MTLSPLDLDIRWRRGRLVVRFFAGLALSVSAAMAAFALPAQPSNALWLAAGSVVFLLLTIRATILLIASHEPAIRIDETGFESPLLTHGRIDWRDVDDVIFAKRRRTLYLDVVVAEEATKRIRRSFFLTLGASRSDRVLFDLSALKIEAKDLIPIFKERARAARGPHLSGPLSLTGTNRSPAQRKPQIDQPIFAYSLILLLTAILLAETLLRLRAGPDPLSIDPLTLLGLGGTQRIAVLDRGEVWRLVTATLLHGGWLHLAGNAVALWFAARLIERLVGWRWFAAIFAISAITGTIVSIAVNPPLMVGVGASGGIVGLAAATAVLAFRFPAEVRSAMLVGGLRIVIPAMLPLLTAKRAGTIVVDVAAHAGGAVAGALAAAILLCVWTARRPEPPFRRLALGIATAFFGIALASLYPITGSYEIAKAVAALDPTFPTRFKDAIPGAKALLALYPRDPRVRAAFAESLVAEGDTPGAESTLSNALRDKAMLEPGRTTDLEPYLRVRLAQLLFDEGKASDAAATVAPICGVATGNFKPALARMRLCR